MPARVAAALLRAPEFTALRRRARVSSAAVLAVATGADVVELQRLGVTPAVAQRARALLERSTAIALPAHRPEEGRTGSWTLPVPDGAYAIVPAWSSADQFIEACAAGLRSSAGLTARKSQGGLSTRAAMAVAVLDAGSAEFATGRSLATANETVARRAGISARTVRRARAVFRALGLYVTVVPGRYLTVEERKAAQALHGGVQLRAASVRALTVPQHVAKTGRLSKINRLNKPPHLPRRSPRRASATRSGAARPSAWTKSSNFGMNAHVPRDVGIQRLAAELVDVHRLGWLLQGRHIGVLCSVLTRAGVRGDLWSARDVLQAIDRFAAASAVRVASVVDQRDPLAYFAWQLRAALAADPVPPSVAAAERDRLRRQRADRAAAERELEQARQQQAATSMTAEQMREISASFVTRRVPRPRPVATRQPDPAGLAAARAELDALRARLQGPREDCT